MNPELLFTILGFSLTLLLTVVGFVFALGQRDAKFRALEERVKEDREKNSEQHKEFYVVKDRHTDLEAQFKDVLRRMEKIEEGIEKILDRLPERRTS